MMQSTDVVVAGHICLDLIPDLSTIREMDMETLMLPGHLSEIGTMRLSTGGAVPNLGLGLGRLGIPTHLIAKVGADPLGDLVSRILSSHQSGAADRLLVDEGIGTSYTVLSLIHI